MRFFALLLSDGSLTRGALAAALVTLPLLAVARPASALQPLDEFVAAAKGRNLDNREAQATADQRVHEARQAWGRIGPSFVAKATYTRNQYDAVIPAGSFGARSPAVTIQGIDQGDASFTLNLPIVDVGAWHRVGGATATAEAAKVRAEATGLSVEKDVVRAYLQVVADEATLTAAQQALATSQESQTIVGTRRQAGSASDLDTERARAEVERARQVVASADQARAVARRSLSSLTGLTPDEGSAKLPDDGLGNEPELAALEPAASKLPAVRAAALETRAADRSAERRLGRARAHRDRHGGGAAHHRDRLHRPGRGLVRGGLGDVDAGSLRRTSPPGRRARRARPPRCARSAPSSRPGTICTTTWQEVRADIARARAARAEAEASAHAARLARERYQAGAATQLDVQQAERDAFNSEVARISAQADLAYARAAVRLDSGRPR